MKMSYCVLGTNNMAASIEYYDGLFETTGIDQLAATGKMTFWQGEGFAFAVAMPFNEEVATNGNGTMIGFSVDSTDEVKRLHARAIELGGTCEGEPNQRGPRFSAYVRDLDKNKLCFFQ
jgi:predicted lactoylglutathione lyase